MSNIDKKNLKLVGSDDFFQFKFLKIDSKFWKVDFKFLTKTLKSSFHVKKLCKRKRSTETMTPKENWKVGYSHKNISLRIVQQKVDDIYIYMFSDNHVCRRVPPLVLLLLQLLHKCYRSSCEFHASLSNLLTGASYAPYKKDSSY